MPGPASQSGPGLGWPPEDMTPIYGGAAGTPGRLGNGEGLRPASPGFEAWCRWAGGGVVPGPRWAGGESGAPRDESSGRGGAGSLVRGAMAGGAPNGGAPNGGAPNGGAPNGGAPKGGASEPPVGGWEGERGAARSDTSGGEEGRPGCAIGGEIGRELASVAGVGANGPRPWLTAVAGSGRTPPGGLDGISGLGGRLATWLPPITPTGTGAMAGSGATPCDEAMAGSGEMARGIATPCSGAMACAGAMACGSGPSVTVCGNGRSGGGLEDADLVPGRDKVSIGGIGIDAGGVAGEAAGGMAPLPSAPGSDASRWPGSTRGGGGAERLGPGWAVSCDKARTWVSRPACRASARLRGGASSSAHWASGNSKDIIASARPRAWRSASSAYTRARSLDGGSWGAPTILCTAPIHAARSRKSPERA